MLSLQDPQRGFLCSAGLDPEILVEFQFNPTQLTDSRKINYASLGAPGRLMPIRQYTQGGDRTLSFKIRIDAMFQNPADHTGLGTHGIGIAVDEVGGITPELNKYRAFVYPKNPYWPYAAESFVWLYEGTNEFASPPTAVFGFGANRVIDCIVTEVGITELFFNEELAPLRADVSLTLVEYVP